jgi:mannose-6-phosphate isomerase-like protein (cupin superfamily)
MQYKYSLPENKSFETDDILGFAYSNAGDNPNIEAMHIIADGHSGKATTGDYDRVYLVLVGEGEFTVTGETFSVTKDDVVVLPKNTNYEYRGSMELFEVNAPAYPVENNGQ